MSRLLFTGGTVVTADDSFHGGPASFYVRGNLVHRDDEVVGERASGRFVERSLRTANVEVKV